jgi:hypothetical protein
MAKGWNGTTHRAVLKRILCVKCNSLFFLTFELNFFSFNARIMTNLFKAPFVPREKFFKLFIFKKNFESEKFERVFASP